MRANRSLKEATVKRYHYDNQRQLEDHLTAFLDAYNFAKRLKTLRGLTPYNAILQGLGRRARALQVRSNPSHCGTEHLVIKPVAWYCRVLWQQRYLHAASEDAVAHPQTPREDQDGASAKRDIVRHHDGGGVKNQGDGNPN